MLRAIAMLSAAVVLCGSGAIAQTQNSSLAQPNLFPNMPTANGLPNTPVQPGDTSSTVMLHVLNATPGYTSWPPSYPNASIGPGYQSTQPTYLSTPNVMAPQFQSAAPSAASSSGAVPSSSGANTTPGGTAAPSGTAGTTTSAAGATGAPSANCVPGQTLPAC